MVDNFRQGTDNNSKLLFQGEGCPERLKITGASPSFKGTILKNKSNLRIQVSFIFRPQTFHRSIFQKNIFYLCCISNVLCFNINIVFNNPYDKGVKYHQVTNDSRLLKNLIVYLNINKLQLL